jgi:hypothetical protein
MPLRLRAFFRFLLSLVLGCAAALHAPGALAGLKPKELAIVINEDDPDSVAVGAYYRQRRDIPAANVVKVRIPGKPQRLTPAQFRLLKEEIDSKLGPNIQAVLMIWTTPYAVDCNSLTGAYTLGFDGAQCARTCAAGQPSPYFNSKSARPFTDHAMRPSMLLPITSVKEAKALIDRGVAAGRSRRAALLPASSRATCSRARATCSFTRPAWRRSPSSTPCSSYRGPWPTTSPRWAATCWARAR